MWRPLGPKGPIELNTGAGAITLIELSDLARFTAQRKWSVLVLAPASPAEKQKPTLFARCWSSIRT
jgi:hypothetical protein